MLSTAGGGKNISKNSTKAATECYDLSSPPSKSSSSATASSFDPSTIAISLSLHPRTRAMEEVWKDISLASLHNRPSTDDPNRSNNFRALTFQDFLARPFNKNQPTSIIPGGHITPASPPATALSLNSAPDQFNLLSNSDPLRSDSLLQAQPFSNLSSLNVPFDVLASSSTLPATMGKKRFPESDQSNPGDRRHKRMIKNRESAARSRARKQAYTTELELEVAHLMEENARLKRQQEQLCLAAATQVPKKHALHRTSTAPF